MAITNGYTDLTTIKAHIGITDTTDDTRLERIVGAVSRQIDDHCRRRFYAATQTRVYTAQCSSELLVDDLLSVSTLKTDTDGDGTYETTWATTDYRLAPPNAQLESQPEPYWLIRTSPLGSYGFPVGIVDGVQIVGSWGFASSTPPVVTEACLLQSARIFERSKAAFGIAGDPTLGAVRLSAALDPDVRELLRPLIRKVAR